MSLPLQPPLPASCCGWARLGRPVPAPSPSSRHSSHVLGDRGIADGVRRSRNAGLAAVAAATAVQAGHVHAVEAVVRLPWPWGRLLLPILIGASAGRDAQPRLHPGPRQSATRPVRGQRGCRHMSFRSWLATDGLWHCGQVTLALSSQTGEPRALTLGLYTGMLSVLRGRGHGPSLGGQRGLGAWK